MKKFKFLAGVLAVFLGLSLAMAPGVQAGSLSNYLELELLDHVLGAGTRNYTSPTVYVALSTADPTDSCASIAEPVGNNYARLTTAAADWAVASGGATSNATALTFNEASGSWGTISHFALYDAVTAGNCLAQGALTVSKAVGAGDTPRFAIGDLDVTLD